VQWRTCATLKALANLPRVCAETDDIFDTLILLILLLQRKMKRMDLDPLARFQIFKVHRLKVISQSSASKEASFKLLELKKIFKECEKEVR
jgi:hypothetical protein